MGKEQIPAPNDTQPGDSDEYFPDLRRLFAVAVISTFAAGFGARIDRRQSLIDATSVLTIALGPRYAA
jgi:hypothetical protein